MKNNRTRMNREERQVQITQVAIKLFVENGYKGTTTAQIAEAAGISEVTLFRNFESKREIFLHGVMPILTHTLEDKLKVDKDKSPEEVLESFLVDRLAVISENHGVVRLVLMENQMNHELGDIDFIKKVGGQIQKGLQEMGFKEGMQDFTMRLIMGSILSFLYLPETDEDTVREFAAELARTIATIDKNR
ncbi:TetR/AcrR family transcriptional regulator [Gudongella sp. SC589]|jgi:AcrR family transcriptional regulator|uniref:TetR/AcrR family transcriptional regulator n=1 Tax=Gudongella sp. SC589 TaxID=3385990 RepID=UPI0039046B1D